MRKRKVNRDIVILSVLTLITVLTWIVFDVYKALHETTLPKILQEQMKPLEPMIDKKKIEKLKERLVISEKELEKIVIPEVEEIASFVETPESTESGTSNVPATFDSGATPSGEL